MERKYLLLALVIFGIIVGYVGYVLYVPPSPTPTPTPTPTPLRMISFEEATEYTLQGAYQTAGKWQFSEYRWLGDYECEPFVSSDGLLEGHLEWRASNGTLYEAEYPSGMIHGEIEHFTGVEDLEEYYVWEITLMDGAVCHIDARNGEFLSFSPSRFPGVLKFEAAVRIVHAPQKKIEEWSIQDYERIGDFETRPYETPNGLVKGHLLRRASNGTLYEVQFPSITYTIGKVVIIEAPDDKEEYNIWEITTEDKIFYIDSRNGIIRLILGENPS